MKNKLLVQITPTAVCNMLKNTPREVKRGLKILAVQNNQSMSEYVSQVLIVTLQRMGFSL